MNILGVDPGLNACGVALYVDGKIETVTIRIVNRHEREYLPHRIDVICERLQYFAFRWATPWDLLVIEKPQVYEESKLKGDPNDLIDLAILAGAMMKVVPAGRVLLPRPVQWKGSIPKRIHHRRIRARVPDLGRCSSDAMDAVGLCLYGLKYAKPST